MTLGLPMAIWEYHIWGSARWGRAIPALRSRCCTQATLRIAPTAAWKCILSFPNWRNIWRDCWWSQAKRWVWWVSKRDRRGRDWVESSRWNHDEWVWSWAWFARPLPTDSPGNTSRRRLNSGSASNHWVLEAQGAPPPQIIGSMAFHQWFNARSAWRWVYFFKDLRIRDRFFLGTWGMTILLAVNTIVHQFKLRIYNRHQYSLAAKRDLLSDEK